MAPVGPRARWPQSVPVAPQLVWGTSGWQVFTCLFGGSSLGEGTGSLTPCEIPLCLFPGVLAAEQLGGNETCSDICLLLLADRWADEELGKSLFYTSCTVDCVTGHQFALFTSPGVFICIYKKATLTGGICLLS